MDFCLVILHFLTPLAVNAKGCVNRNCITDMKVLTDYGNDFLENSGKKGGEMANTIMLKNRTKWI